MRHKGAGSAAGRTVVGNVAGRLSRITDYLVEEEHPGKHKRAGQPLIPVQKVPTHETIEAEPEAPVEDAVVVEMPLTPIEPVEPVELPVQVAKVALEAQESAPETAPESSLAIIPASAQWKSSHGPRMFAAALLLLAVGGTSALGLRYAETRGSDELLSMVIGVGVVVGLWALLIASTPQVVSLRGSMLTVRNSSGSERFDLADGLQPVDVVGEPRSSQWALLLHRSNNTSVVLRRRDVDAVALDPIVRHYRALAEQRYADRQARFRR